MLVRMATLSLARLAPPLSGPGTAVLLHAATPTAALLRSRAIPMVRMMATSDRPPLQAIAGFKTQFAVIKPGGAGGAVVSSGSAVTVHATGVVVETGKKFWSTKDPGQQPFSYVAGKGQVITGWDRGLLGMTVGEERMVVIPAEEGYGAGGFPQWGIPAGGTLEFTLEVLEIKT